MKFSRGVTVSLVGLLVAMGLSTAPAQAATSPAVTLVACMNKSRIAAGLKPLAINTGLASIAQKWSSTMASRKSLGHNPALETQVQSGWTDIGENVGQFGTSRTAVAIHDGFMSSSGHRENVMLPSFNSVGVGVTVNAGYQWVTEVFTTYGSASGYVPPASLCKAASTPTPPKKAVTPAKPSTPKPTKKAVTPAKPSTPAPSKKSTTPAKPSTSGKSAVGGSSSLNNSSTNQKPPTATGSQKVAPDKKPSTDPTPQNTATAEPEDSSSSIASSSPASAIQPVIDPTLGLVSSDLSASDNQSTDNMWSGLAWLIGGVLLLTSGVLLIARRSRRETEPEENT